MPHKLIAKNSFFQILTRGITSFVGLLVTIMVASAFGAQGYGDYTKITALVSLFYLVVDFGLNALFLQKKDQEQQFWNFVFFRAMLAIGVIVVLNSGLFILSAVPQIVNAYASPIRIGIALYSFTIVTQALTLSASAVFQKQLRYDYLLYSTLIGSSASFGLVVLGFMLHVALFFMLLGLVTGSLVTALCSLFFSQQKKTANFTLRFGKQLLIQSLPIGLLLIANLIYFRIDIIILSLFVSTDQVGLYGLSYRFFDFFLALPLFLSNSLYPILLDRNNTRNGSQTRRQYAYVYSTVGVGLMLVAFLFAPLLGWIKPEFAASVLSFRILILSLPLFFITSFLQWILIAKQTFRYLLSVYTVIGLLNILLNVIYIPHYGYLASAVVTDICELLVFVLLCIPLVTKQQYVA